MDKLTEAQHLIAHLGGTAKTARLFEIEPGSVSDWRRNGIPKSRMMYLRVARADLFDANGNVLECAEKKRRSNRFKQSGEAHGTGLDLAPRF